MGYTITEAAGKLGVSTATVRRRIKRGEIKAELIDTPYGQQYIIDESVFNPAAIITEVVQVEKTLTLEQFVEAFQGVLTQHDRGMSRAVMDKIDEQSQEIKQLREEISELKEIIESKQEEKPSLLNRLFKRRES